MEISDISNNTIFIILLTINIKINNIYGSTDFYEIYFAAHWGGDFLAQGYDQLLQLFISSILPVVMTRYGLQHLNSKAEVSSIIKWQYTDRVQAGDTLGLISQLIDVSTDYVENKY